jgi:glycosyltransferase involved in cell wall biosynthesis
MATILFSSFAVRHPVGGVLSNNLQFLTGFRRLGHDVYLLEKAGYDESCFDPERRLSGDDCSCGTRRIGQLLDQHDLHGKWCYVAADGSYHGMCQSEVESVIVRADLFIDRGLHRSWDDETAEVPVRVLLDPDPGFRQVKLAHAAAKGRPAPVYDAYYTYGHNVGTPRSLAPTAGLRWRHLFHPVDTVLYLPGPPPTPGSPWTTIMNWRALEQVAFSGRVYGMKDAQFQYFEDIPTRVSVPMEVAVEGASVPEGRLREKGWRVVSALDATASYATYHNYLRRSFAEFSVVKDVYRGLNVGWFSDRSAAYLAHGRPVVVQANGIAGHLPVGEGLFEVADADEAVDAIERVRRDPARHSAAARRIAEEHLDTRVVLGRFLDELGLASPRRAITAKQRSASR